MAGTVTNLAIRVVNVKRLLNNHRKIVDSVEHRDVIEESIYDICETGIEDDVKQPTERSREK